MKRSYVCEAITLLVACSLTAIFPISCRAILIDDFSAEQPGINTGLPAEFDSIQHPSVLGGVRHLWGGGSSVPGNCATSECSTEVANGVMTIVPGADCAGTGNVTWSGLDASGDPTVFATALNFDASSYLGFEIEIASIVGQVKSLFSIYSGGLPPKTSNTQQLTVFFDSPGKHLIRFSEFPKIPGRTNLSDLDEITMSTFVEVGEFVAFDAVRIVAPEPSCVALVVAAVAFYIPLRQRNRK